MTDINIDVNILIVHAGSYDERINEPLWTTKYLPKLVNYLDGGGDSMWDDDVQLLHCEKHIGVTFKVTNLMAALRLINDFYVQEHWYCACYGIDNMQYNPTTKTLKVNLDCESG